MKVQMLERDLMKSMKLIMLFLQNQRETAMILIHLVKGHQSKLTILLIIFGLKGGMGLMKKINLFDLS